ncbi:ester cyclase [Pseudonocardia sp. CA-107938]|uniref:ester cyclase n=1 Tax=Pseudonocardia sp. CA-107938 TaxID=3240021 RepID=UPI003D8BDFB5
MSTDPTVANDLASVAVRSIEMMPAGDLAAFAEVVHPDGFTRERRAAPPWARGTGPAAFHALAEWLRAAIDDLSYEIHHVVADGDLVTVNSTMHGRHTATVVFWTEDAQVDQAFVPTGRRFAITQSHWFRMADGKVLEHWANRDDLGMARQLGWVPPTPAYLVRCALAARKARRAPRSA